MAEGEPAAKRVRLNDDGTPEGTTPSAVREMDQPVQPPADTHFFFFSLLLTAIKVLHARNLPLDVNEYELKMLFPNKDAVVKVLILKVN